MIKITLNDVVSATQTFNKLMQQPVKGSVAFKIARLARELDKEMQTFNAERQKIIDKYGEKDENGQLISDENNNIKFDSSKIQEINEEFNSLLTTELEINAEKLSMDCLDNFELTPQEMIEIEKFFEE